MGRPEWGGRPEGSIPHFSAPHETLVHTFHSPRRAMQVDSDRELRRKLAMQQAEDKVPEDKVIKKLHPKP